MLLILSVALIVPAAAVCVYCWGLALYAIATRRTSGGSANPKTRYAIVVPAHNEERLLGTALQSLQAIDYPKDKFKVFVIADNCTDTTPAVAMAHGVECWERTDAERRGKGFALAWAFERILPLSYDALVVLDADCVLDERALQVFDGLLNGNVRVLQANVVVGNPDASPIAFAAALGNCIEGQLFYAPKSELGLAVFLQGTGVVYHRTVLETEPWNAYSIAEDTEYTLRLVRRGIKIRFVKDVKVKSTFPVDAGQLVVQRKRWASGNVSMGRRRALPLIREGLLRRSLVMLDAGWTFFVISRPLVLFEMLLSVFASALCLMYSPGLLPTVVCWTAVLIMTLYAAYLFVGAIMLGLNGRRILLLLRCPLVVFRLVAIALQALVCGERRWWARTPR